MTEEDKQTALDYFELQKEEEAENKKRQQQFCISLRKKKLKPRKTLVQAERKPRFQKRKIKFSLYLNRQTKIYLRLMRRRRGKKTSLERE